jgi:hypothetical protein
MLAARQVGVPGQITRELIAPLVARLIAERMARLRLELLFHVLLGAAAVAAVRIAPLGVFALELVASVLSMIRHLTSVEADFLGRARAFGWLTPC